MADSDEVMSPDHPEWDRFLTLLTEAVDLDPEAGRVNNCNHTHRHTTRLLREMGANVGHSLDYFIEEGGTCDCEVVLNVGTTEGE